MTSELTEAVALLADIVDDWARRAHAKNEPWRQYSECDEDDCKRARRALELVRVVRVRDTKPMGVET